MSDFNPNDCPLGAKHESDLRRLEEKLEMSVNRLDEKLNDIREDMTAGFSSITKKVDEAIARWDLTEHNLDERIDRRADARIEAHKKELVWKGWKKALAWIGGILGSSACVTWILKTLLELLEK